MITHQPLDPAPSDRLALAAQRGMYAWAAVGFPAVAMYLTYPVEQALIFVHSLADRPVTPGVVATGADTEQAA